MKYSFVILLFSASIFRSALSMKLPESSTSDTLVPSTDESPDKGLEDSSSSRGESTDPVQESSKGFQLLNNTSSILPVSNSSLQSGISGFIDELAAVAGSIASGVSQVIETATGVIQNASTITNITKSNIPTAGESSDSKADGVTEKPVENTSAMMEVTSRSPDQPNHDVNPDLQLDQGAVAVSSAAEGKGSTSEIPTTPDQPVDATSTEKSVKKGNDPADPISLDAPDAQEGLLES